MSYNPRDFWPPLARQCTECGHAFEPETQTQFLCPTCLAYEQDMAAEEEEDDE